MTRRRPGPPAARPSRRTQPGRPGRALPVVAAGTLLLRRQLRRDAALVAAFTALLALSTLLVALGPRAAARTLDDGAAAAARDLGDRADVVATTGIRPDAYGSPGGAVTSSGEAFLGHADRFLDSLPPELRVVTDRTEVTLTTATVRVLGGDGDLDGHVGRRTVSVAALSEQGIAGVELVAGRLPVEVADAAEREVAVPQRLADAWRIAPGDTIVAAGPETLVQGTLPDGTPGMVSAPDPVELTVVGVVAPRDPDARTWLDMPGLWEPEPGKEPGEAGVVLADRHATADVLTALGGVGNGRVRVVVDPDAVTLARAEDLQRLLGVVIPAPDRLVGGAVSVSLTTDLLPAIRDYLLAARAASAQMSVPVTGVVGVAATVLLLASRLLVSRRHGQVDLERARGSSVAAVLWRAGLESVGVTAVGVGAGLALAHLVLDGPLLTPAVVAVTLAGLLAVPAQLAWRARRSWTGRREPANRRERALVARRRDARRVVADLGVVLLALGAVVSLRGRGLLASATAQDPFLAAAPILLAVAVTVVAQRVHPWFVGGVARTARRSPGATGIVAASRATRGLSVLALLALSLGVSVAVAGALLVDTVREGQDEASWERTGGDAAITADDVTPIASLLTGAAGVDVVAGYLAPEISLHAGAARVPVSLLAVDDGYGGSVAGLPHAGTRLDALDRLRTPGDDGRVAAVVDDSLAAYVGAEDLEIFVRGKPIELAIVGTTDHRPTGEAPGPFLYLDLGAADGALPAGLAPNVLWLHGPGTGDAVAALDLPPRAHAQLRTGWLAERRTSPLVHGTAQMMAAAVPAVAVLAAIGLVATALVGARERGRTLSLLRTLGMRARTGWWLAVAELGPVVLAAVVAGSLAGVAAVALLGPALGLDALAGGVTIPPMAISPVAPVAVAVGGVVLLLVAVLAEVAAHRNDRLNDVLRVGESVA